MFGPAEALYLIHGDTERLREAERVSGCAALALRLARCSAEEEEEGGGVANIVAAAASDALLSASIELELVARAAKGGRRGALHSALRRAPSLKSQRCK